MQGSHHAREFEPPAGHFGFFFFFSSILVGGIMGRDVKVKFDDGVEITLRDFFSCYGCGKLGHDNLCSRYQVRICWLNRRCSTCKEEGKAETIET